MSPSQGEIVNALRQIPVPGGHGDLVQSGAVEALEVDGTTVRLSIAISSSAPVASDELKAEVERRLGALEGVEQVEVSVQVSLAMAGAPPAAASTAQAEPESGPAWADRIAGIRHVVVGASGKGGVGKSTVAANLALAMARQGRRVGLLDADIYGPSQQMMMGTSGQPMGDPSGKILPLDAPGGVKVMSFGFIIEPDQPVIWRGPMLMKALEQLLGDVLWGELDELVIDLPPGTGDVALTLCQNVPLAGAVIVTTPQDVALVDARKALHMFRRLAIPVLGVVENMSHFMCPSCGHVEHVFGAGGGQRTATELEVPFLGGIPLDPVIVGGGDSGRPVVLEHADSAAAKAFADIAAGIVGTLE
jgi:ATP-binding protein involved in chromosome partitioning